MAAPKDTAQELQQGAFRRPQGSSPPTEGANRGQTRPSQPPRSSSSASAATQDSSTTEYARTDSGGSGRDPAGVSERRASGAAAGVYLSSLLLCFLHKADAGSLSFKYDSSKLRKAGSVCCYVSTATDMMNKFVFPRADFYAAIQQRNVQSILCHC